MQQINNLINAKETPSDFLFAMSTLHFIDIGATRLNALLSIISYELSTKVQNVGIWYNNFSP